MTDLTPKKVAFELARLARRTETFKTEMRAVKATLKAAGLILDE